MTTVDDEKALRSIWRRQAIENITLSPEQLRRRAEKFQAHIRRRNIRDYACAALVVLGYGTYVVLLKGMLTRLGSAMMALWGLYFIYGLHRFGSSRPLPSNSKAQSCIAFHQQELRRQRDLALSRPWGIALAVPGIVLFAIGMQMAGKHPENWQPSIALIGTFVFVAIAVIIDGKLVADRLQRELDSLDAIQRDSEGSHP